MSPLENPVRLRTLLGRHSVLGRGIEAVQASGPTDEQLKALEGAVLAGVAASAATAVVTGTAQAAKSVAGLSWGTAKLVLCLAVGASIGTGGAMVWQKGRGSHSVPAGVAPKSEVEAVRAPVLPALEAIPSKPAPALLPEAAPADHPVAATKPAKSKLRTTSRDPATDAEVPLLEQAHRALLESSLLALKLAREHERRFPSSTLDQERELIEVTALVDLGRMDEARRLAHRFSEQHPGSAYAGRIDRIVRQPTQR